MTWRDYLTPFETVALERAEVYAASCDEATAEAYAAVRKIRNACVQRQRRSKGRP